MPSSEEIQALDEDPALNISVTQDSFIFALRALDRMQANVWLSVNLSCQYVGSGKMFFRPISKAVGDLETLRRKVGRRLVVEVTERGVAGQHESSFINELTSLHTIAVGRLRHWRCAPLSHAESEFQQGEGGSLDCLRH